VLETKKMRIIILAVLLMTSAIISAQKSIIFPSIKGVGLDDKSVTVPAGNGKYSIIGIAFNRKAEDDLKKWLNPLYDAFIKKEKGSTNFDMAEFHDVNFVFIPMINGFKRVAEEFKKGTDKHYWPYIMDTEKTDIKELQKQLGVEDTKIPYFFVLDKDGKIVAEESGNYSEKKMATLEDAVE
jgi:hypothetical protein